MSTDRVIYDPSHLLPEPDGHVSGLTDQTTGLSLENADSSPSTSQSQPMPKSIPQQRTRLVILQPLAGEKFLSACRDPSSRILRKDDGTVCGRQTTEFLNLQPLLKAWQVALTKATLAAPITNVVFDLRLPESSEETASNRRVIMDGVVPVLETGAPRGPGADAYVEVSIEAEPLDESDLNVEEKESDNGFWPVSWEVAMPRRGGIGIITQHVMTLVVTLATAMRMRTHGQLTFGIAYDHSIEELHWSMNRLQKHLDNLGNWKSKTVDEEGSNNTRDKTSLVTGE